MPKIIENKDFLTMLEEAQKYYETQVRSLDILRDHAKTILGAASILVSVFATFGAMTASDTKPSYYAWIILLLLVLYGWLMVNSLAATAPGLFYHPIVPTEKEYSKAFLGKNERDIVKQRLANYLAAIPKNERIIEKRRNLGRLLTIQLGIMVVIILISNLLFYIS
jgi:cobalamin synthase